MAGNHWLSVEPSSGNEGITEIKVKALRNEGLNQRKATLIFKAGDATQRISIIQKNASNPNVDSLKLKLGTSSLKFNDTIVISAEYENAEGLDWKIESNVQDKSIDIKDASRYIITDISDDTKSLTVSYKKSKIENDLELGDVNSLILTVTVSTKPYESDPFVDYKTMTLKLYSDVVRRINKPVVEPYDKTATSVTFLINPATADDDITKVADMYYIYCGTSTTFMPLVSVQYMGASTTGLTYTYNITDESSKVFIKVYASYSGGRYLDSEMSDIVVGETTEKKVLDTPDVQIASVDADSFNIRWTGIDGAIRYRVFVSPDYYDGKSNDFTSIEPFRQAVIDNPDALASHTITNLAQYNVIARQANSDSHPDTNTEYMICVVGLPPERSGSAPSLPGTATCTWTTGKTEPYFIISQEESITSEVSAAGLTINNWITILSNISYSTKSSESFLSLITGSYSGVNRQSYTLNVQQNTNESKRTGEVSVVPAQTFNPWTWSITQGNVMYNFFLANESQNIRDNIKEVSFKLFVYRNGIPESSANILTSTDDESIIQRIVVTPLSGDVQGATHLVTLTVKHPDFTEASRTRTVICTSNNQTKTFKLNLLNVRTPYFAGVDIFTMCNNNRQWAIGTITFKNGIYPDPDNTKFSCASKSLVVVFTDNVAPEYKCRIRVKGVYYDGIAYYSTNEVGTHSFEETYEIIPSQSIINNSEGSGVYYNGISIANGMNLGIKEITRFEVEKIE